MVTLGSLLMNGMAWVEGTGASWEDRIRDGLRLASSSGFACFLIVGRNTDSWCIGKLPDGPNKIKKRVAGRLDYCLVGKRKRWKKSRRAVFMPGHMVFFSCRRVAGNQIVLSVDPLGSVGLSHL